MNTVSCIGVGIISAIGKGLCETSESLFSCSSGLSLCNDSSLTKNPTILGLVPFSDEQLRTMCGIEDRNANRTDLISLYSVKMAIEDAGIEIGDGSKVALISGSTAGGINYSEKEYCNFVSGKEIDLKSVKGHTIGSHTDFVAKHIGITGFVTSLSTACSSSLAAITLGCELIKSGAVDYAICGGVDALSKFTISGFTSLGLQSCEPCKPFDKDRTGLNLGEGAAYIVLTSKIVKEPYCYIAGHKTASDSFHTTATSKDATGPYLSFKGSIENAGISSNDIDFIVTHGTATPNNDESEAVALKKIFGESVPKFVSAKGYTGHTLGAAGSIGMVCSIIALKNQRVFPSVGFVNTDPHIGLIPNMTDNKTNIRYVMTEAIGFGGGTTTLIIKSPNID